MTARGSDESPSPSAAAVRTFGSESFRQAIKGPEPSWQIYSRLLNIYIGRKDFAKAQGVMDGAVTRFDNSPVLLPKRIEILHGAGRQQEAEALLPQCEGFDIKELYALCRKSAGKDED